MKNLLKLVQNGDFFVNNFASKEEYFLDTCEYLIKNEYVERNFCKALFERELVYPTGLKLNSNPIAVAIPHAEIDYVLKDAIIINVFDESIEFNSMENPCEVLPVKISFMLLLTSADNHINALKELMSLLSSADTIKRIINLKSKNELIHLLQAQSV